MTGQREVGGVVLAFVGFGFLVLSFKGTWHNVYLALTGKSAPAPSGSRPSSTTTAARLPGSSVQPSASGGAGAVPLAQG